MKKEKTWFLFALITTVFWGVWGAFSDLPEKAGFPGTLIYCVWAISMIIPMLIGLKVINWKVDLKLKPFIYGMLIGLTGAGGQLALLTRALKEGPAHLIFPIISLSPLVTIILSYFLLKERVGKLGWTGILLTLIAIPLLSMTPAGKNIVGNAWLWYALLVFLAWGVQGYLLKLANNVMKAESIFFYMTITGILLIPVALHLTDYQATINFGFKGPYLAFLIQLLNSLGALCIVYAFRYGKAIIVSPMTNTLAPVITIVLSLILYRTIPNSLMMTGMALAIISTLLFAFEDEHKL